MPALGQQPSEVDTVSSDMELELQHWITVRPQGGAFRLAVPDFMIQGPADETARSLAGILRHDLNLSGETEVIDPQVYFSVAPPLRSQGTDFGPWALVGAQGVISGVYTEVSEDRVQLDLRLFRVANAELVLGKRYTGSRQSIRRMVHRFADDVLLALTGKRGCFESQIAFVSDRTGRQEIYIMESDGFNPTQITKNHTMNISPSFSPDGSRILFTSYKDRNPDLFLMDMSGKGVKLSSHPGPNLAGEFSKDGGRVAFARISEGDNMDLYVMGPGGGEPRRITYHPALDLSPSWSPNGSLIAFVSDRAGSPQIYILDGPESESNRPVRVSIGSYCTSPSFSPDGRYIVYSGRRHGGFDLFIIDLQAKAGQSVQALTDMRGNEEDPTWSPDGRMVAFSATLAGNYDIYVMNIYGGEPVKITDSKAKDIAPSWGPALGEQ